MQDLPRSFKVESLSKVFNQAEDPYASGKPSHPKKTEHESRHIQTWLKSPLTCISFAILDSQEQLLKPLKSNFNKADERCVMRIHVCLENIPSLLKSSRMFLNYWQFRAFLLVVGAWHLFKNTHKSHNVDEWHIFYQMVHTNPHQNLNWPVFLGFQLKILTDHQ